MQYLFVLILFVFSLSSSMAQSSWTGWFDRDNPSATGDWELLADLGDVCLGDDIVDVQARRISDQLPAESTGQVFLYYDTTNGFVCRNADQVNNEQCFDYEVRFKCESLLIDLISFSADTILPSGNTVSLKWKTANEHDNAGFDIWRAKLENGELTEITRVNEQVIPSKSMTEWTGTSYSVEDTTVTKGNTYYYVLVDINNAGENTLQCEHISAVSIGEPLQKTDAIEEVKRICEEYAEK